MHRSILCALGGVVVAIGFGPAEIARSARADDAPVPASPPPQPAGVPQPAPAGGLSDADIERIARKIIEIQERERSKSSPAGAPAPSPTPPPAVAPPVAAPPAPSAPTMPFVSAVRSGAFDARAGAAARVELPPPQGARGTRLGVPLLAAPGGGGVRYVTGDTRGGGRPAVPSPTRFEVPTADERYFLLNRAAATPAPSRGEGDRVSYVEGPSDAERRGARLLGARGHSPSAIQDDVAYGDRERSLFLGASTGFVSRTYAPGPAAVRREFDGKSFVEGGEDSPTEGAGKGAYQEILPGWLAMVAAQGKFSIAASSAANRDFTALGQGRANTLAKGFNADSVDISNRLGFGSLAGDVRAAYFANPSGTDSEVELLHAYGLAPFKDIPSDAKERLILRLGKGAVPVGLYHGSEWETWAWQSRPVVYGRLFNGNLTSLGVDALIRPEVRDVHKDLLVRIGMYNAASDGMAGFLAQGSAGPIGGYPTISGERYSFTDFAYFADAAGVVDLTPSSDSTLLLDGGGFALFGPNATGVNGETLVVGARARLAWLRCRNETRGVADGFLLESEWLHRDYHVDRNGALAPTDLEDWGAYVSAVYTMDRAVPGRLSVGAKWELAEGSGENAAGALRVADPNRANRTRWGALVAWEPESTMPVFGKFAFSLEYILDDADFLREDEHSLILGLQVR